MLLAKQEVKYHPTKDIMAKKGVQSDTVSSVCQDRLDDLQRADIEHKNKKDQGKKQEPIIETTLVDQDEPRRTEPNTLVHSLFKDKLDSANEPDPHYKSISQKEGD